MSKICPVCGDGHVINEAYAESVSYADRLITYQKVTAYCEACGTEMPTPEMVKLNCRALVSAKNKADGLLVGEEILEFRKRFKISQEVAAKLFGGGKTTFSKYEADDISHNVSMDRLLRLCMNRPECIASLAEMNDVALPDETKAAIYRNRRHQPTFDMSFIRASMLGTEKFVADEKANSEDYFFDQKKMNKEDFPFEELLAA